MDTKVCPKCGKGVMTPAKASVELSYGSFETVRWDCQHCGAQRWESLWEGRETLSKWKEGS